MSLADALEIYRVEISLYHTRVNEHVYSTRHLPFKQAYKVYKEWLKREYPEMRVRDIRMFINLRENLPRPTKLE